MSTPDPLAAALEAIWPYEDEPAYFAQKATDLRFALATLDRAGRSDAGLREAVEIADWRAYAEGQIERRKFVVIEPDQFIAMLDRLDATRPSGDEALHAEKRVAAGLSITDRERAALRPSGDEALRAAALVVASDLAVLIDNPPHHPIADAETHIARVRALATPSSTPRPTVESLEVAIEGLVPGGPGITFEVDALGVRPRTPSSAPDRHAGEATAPIYHLATSSSAPDPNFPDADLVTKIEGEFR